MCVTSCTKPFGHHMLGFGGCVSCMSRVDHHTGADEEQRQRQQQAVEARGQEFQGPPMILLCDFQIIIGFFQLELARNPRCPTQTKHCKARRVKLQTDAALRV